MCSKNVCIYECIFIEVTCCCGRTHDTSKVMTNNDCLTFYVGYDLSRGPSLSYLYVSFTAMMWLMSLCQPLDHYVGTLLIEPFFFFFSFFFFLITDWAILTIYIHARHVVTSLSTTTSQILKMKIETIIWVRKKREDMLRFLSPKKFKKVNSF